MQYLAGFFELSSNRRDIWHGESMAGVGQLRCDYNMALLKASRSSKFCSVWPNLTFLTVSQAPTTMEEGAVFKLLQGLHLGPMYAHPMVLRFE